MNEFCMKIFHNRMKSLGLNYSKIGKSIYDGKGQIENSIQKTRDFFNGTDTGYKTFLPIARLLGYDFEKQIILSDEQQEIPVCVEAALYVLGDKILDTEKEAIIAYAKAGGFRDASKDVVLAWLGDLREAAGRKPSDVFGAQK